MLRPLLVSLAVSTALGALLPVAKEEKKPYVTSTGRVLDSSIEQFVLDTISEWNSPGGVAVAFVQQLENGEWQVETQGYGRAKVDGSAVDESTLFAIASNSKLFTAISAGLLISNKSLETPLTWNTKLRSVIPEWEMANHFASAETTITDAMSHRTGLPRHDFGYSKNETLPSLIRKLPHLKPSAEFRTTWQYNNIMYGALSYLPSLVLPSHPPIARYVKEHIFDPLGLNDTTYSSRAAIKSGRLADAFTRQVNYTGDIFAKGTPRVYPFFIDTDEEGGSLLLEGRNPRTNASVIPADVIRKVASGITVDTGAAPYPELGPVVYGGGQMRSTYRGHEYIEHGGSVPGYRTQIIRFPNEKFGLAVLVNDDTYGTQMHEVIKWRIVDAHLGLQPIDWSGRAKSRLLKAREEKPKLLPRPENATLPSGLDGRYDNPGYGRFLFCSMGAKDAVSLQQEDTQTNFAGNNAQALLQDRRPKDALVSASIEASDCSKLRESADVLLPGVIDPSVPTLLARWDRVWSTHIKLAHYDGGIFNVTILDSVPTGNASEPFWVGGTDEDPDLASACGAVLAQVTILTISVPLLLVLSRALRIPSSALRTLAHAFAIHVFSQRRGVRLRCAGQGALAPRFSAETAADGQREVRPANSAAFGRKTATDYHDTIPYSVRQDAGVSAYRARAGVTPHRRSNMR
ncbi:beta-lactamase/transpeptidase-like protein [Schizophyllum commune H4-8]|nr:beta-lactamase/transpeptidase-like protein [Schizophyllum commune H4-8]KAI5886361.1 beta-lactamase/transpeptidase-like protein [Schizophyllum commune H4-8]